MLLAMLMGVSVAVQAGAGNGVSSKCDQAIEENDQASEAAEEAQQDVKDHPGDFSYVEKSVEAAKKSRKAYLKMKKVCDG